MKTKSPRKTSIALSEKPIVFLDRRVKKLCELTAKDVPPGMDPEDVAARIRHL